MKKDLIKMEKIYHIHGWKDLEFNIPIFPKLLYRFNIIPINILASTFEDTDSPFPKFI